MAYSNNQQSPHTQTTGGPIEKVTGLWERTKYDKKGRAFVLLKSGRINVQGWINLQAFGEDTMLLCVPNLRKRKKDGAPDYWLYACRDHASDSLKYRKDKK